MQIKSIAECSTGSFAFLFTALSYYQFCKHILGPSFKRPTGAEFTVEISLDSD